MLVLWLPAHLVPAHAAPKVVTDIAPVHSLVAAVMEGVGEPDLLIPGNVSPHDASLRPSQARAIEAADLVVWIGPSNTPWLADALSGETLELLDVAPVRLEMREGAALESHDNHADEHDHGDEHGFDPHAWLHPNNARVWADAIARALGQIDAANADIYRTNAASLKERIDVAETAAREALAGVSPRFLILHDATAYFERAFGVRAVGALATAMGARPGAARLRRVSELVGGADCVLIEPAMPERMLNALPGGRDGLRRVTFDVQGAALEPGPGLYPALIEAAAEALASCGAK